MSTDTILIGVNEDVAVHAIELRHPRLLRVANRSWYGLRSHDRALPLSDVGCRALAFHIATTTLKSR